MRTLVIVVAGMLFGAGVASPFAFQDKPESKESKPAAVESKPDPKPASPKPAYTPSPDQLKDLRIAQLEAIAAQQSYSIKAQSLPEYQQFQQAMNKLVAECGKVKSENKWPSGVECDINANPVTFADKQPGPAPGPAPGPSPAPSKK